MKFTVTLKDPDALHESIERADSEMRRDLAGLELEERNLVVERRKERFRDFAAAWLRYGEYVDLEFDEDAKTCVVVKKK